MAAQATCSHRDPRRHRDVPGRARPAPSPLGGARAQREAMDRDAARRAFCGHGRAAVAGGRYPCVFQGAELKTIFTNANLVLREFAELQRSFEVLVEGNRIASVSSTALTRDDATIINVGERTLMPGLI